MRRRIFASGGAAVAILLLTAATTLAGGWALIVPDEGAAEPSKGQATELGFTVLQHGETPASWVTAKVVLEDVASGRTIDVPAKATNADGHFVATATFPSSGYWTWRVELTDLVTDTPPSLLAVLTADGRRPEFDPGATVALIDQANSRLREEVVTSYGARVETLEAQLLGLTSQIDRVNRERNELTARIAAAEQAPDTVPVAGLLAVAVLGGALAGFVMSSLARHSTGASSPTPENAPEGALVGTPAHTH